VLVSSLSLRQFRNYPALDQSFEPGVNLIVGANGNGKTNLLESIYLLATSKSMRGVRDHEMIQWQAAAAVASGTVRRQVRPDVTLEVGLSRTAGKTLSVNGQTQPRVTEFVGALQAVSFCAADINIIRGEPEKRRRFLDLEISQMSPRYCLLLGRYRRVLEQRNQLLRGVREQPRRGRPDSLAVWTEQLVALGGAITLKRAEFIRDLMELAQDRHARLTDDGEALRAAYRPSARLGDDEDPLPSVERVCELMHVQVADRLEDECLRGVSLVGPHRDEVLFLINGESVRRFGSQGQQRTATLSLKLAELQLLREAGGESPVLLLDDVFSELDEQRRAQVLESLGEAEQTFLSATEAGLVSEQARRGAGVFRVTNGTLEAVR